jgi:hypothetical protein
VFGETPARGDAFARGRRSSGVLVSVEASRRKGERVL